jgi:mRNA interferase MazF
VKPGEPSAIPYVPAQGDVVWLDFDPQAGHEQAGRRPAVVLSPLSYNRKVGLAVVCPITSRAKGYPFEVAIPEGLGVSGVALADQVRNVDWRQRRAALIGTLPRGTLRRVLARLGALLREGNE